MFIYFNLGIYLNSIFIQHAYLYIIFQHLYILFNSNTHEQRSKKTSRRPAELTANDSSKISSSTVDFIGLTLPVELIRVFQVYIAYIENLDDVMTLYVI